MLKRIICDKFIDKSAITFNHGLNVIAGDSVATNSIGKTTVLMIIDFAFGGDDYIIKNSDVITNIGDHNVNFVFEFSGQEHYFSRSTDNRYRVSKCDEKFQEISSINKKEYLSFLKEHYECNSLSLSFREIQGRYSRIYGKENIDEKRPLHYVNGEAYQTTIDTLIKLFDKFVSIQELEEKVKSLSDEKKILANAAKKKIIPGITKKEYTQFSTEIVKLQAELSALKDDVSQNTIDLKSSITDETIQLYRRRNRFLNIKNDLESKIKRLKKSPSRRISDISYELNKLKHFIPGIDIKSLKDIQDFHSALSDALKEEYGDSLAELESRLVSILKCIADIDNRMKKIVDIETENRKVLDKIIEITFEMNKMRSAMDFYERSDIVSNGLESSQQELSELKPVILDEISLKLNETMNELTKYIFPEGHNSPRIEFGTSMYSFKTEEDRGTGTAFASLIIFDLSILLLTKLPALIHDLPLFKSIADSTLKSIIELYCKQNKQIFISLDKIDSYDQETTEMVKDKVVISLSAERVLFGKKWNMQ